MRFRQTGGSSAFHAASPLASTALDDPDEFLEPDRNSKRKAPNGWQRRLKCFCKCQRPFLAPVVCIIWIVLVTATSRVASNWTGVFSRNSDNLHRDLPEMNMKQVLELQENKLRLEFDGDRTGHVQLLRMNYHEESQPVQKDKTLKYILYWNPYWNIPNYQFGTGNEPFLDFGCPVADCFATNERDLFDWDNETASLAQFDAILFHAPEFSAQELPCIRSWRQSHQRFIYMNMESPQSHPTPVWGLNHFFNWTMTYRHDSDLVRPYGFFALNNQPSSNASSYQGGPQTFVRYDEHDFFNNVLPHKGPEFRQLAERPNKVAWIVSRCYSPSHREDYVERLREYIDVDIFGGCSGSTPCDHAHADLVQDNCTTLVEEEYKFYLSFENSYCQDYVTEKFFKRMRGNSLVVVLGEDATFYNKIAPPHSHLNILDFPSPQALAETLHMLDRNASAYLSYFWWKDHYTVHNGTMEDHAATMCQLCEMLHNPLLPPKVYDNIEDWHGEQAQCRQELPQVIQDLGFEDPEANDGPLSGWDDAFSSQDAEAIG